MINTSQLSKQNTSKRIKWIPAKIGSGWEYVSLLFVSALFSVSSAYWITSLFFSALQTPLIVASMGAVAVLMFASPASPMASSWAFIVGNLLSGLIGITVFILFGNTPVSAGFAVATAIMAMHITHSMHPPGGATALYAVIGGPLVENLGYLYVLTPVAMNLCIFFIIIRINRWYLYRKQQRLQYAARLHDFIFERGLNTHKTKDQEFLEDDIEQALVLVGGNPDVSPEYLKTLIENTLAHAQIRKLEQSGYHTLQINPPVLEFGDTLLKAWELLHRDDQKVIVVLHPGGKFLGILTLESFITLIRSNSTAAQTGSLSDSALLTSKIEQALRPSGLLETTHPEVCGQLAETIPQLTDLNDAGTLLVKASSGYAAMVNKQGLFQYLLSKD